VVSKILNTKYKGHLKEYVQIKTKISTSISINTIMHFPASYEYEWCFIWGFFRALYIWNVLHTRKFESKIIISYSTLNSERTPSSFLTLHFLF